MSRVIMLAVTFCTVMVCLAGVGLVLAKEHAKWTSLPNDAAAALVVGDPAPDKCCRYGLYTGCEQSTFFACAPGNPICNEGQEVFGSCGHADCPDEMYLFCEVGTTPQPHVNLCKMTGISVICTCPPMVPGVCKRCQYNYTPRSQNSPVAPSVAAVCYGGFPCTTQQHASRCDQ
jgi:hypothetical protein